MHLEHLWAEWSIPGPWHLSPLGGGTNNSIWKVETAEGRYYVLRLLADTTEIPHIRYELAILEALQQLPFLLPLPIRARGGDCIVPYEQENGDTAFAILTPFLSGCSPERDDLVVASHAGLTLARLDQALAALPVLAVPDGFSALPPFGELTRCHPLVSDPLAAIQQLPIPSDHARHLTHILHGVMGSVTALYHHLPQQLLHRDYDPANILVEGQQVVAVLDFEFAGTDLRILDLCVALSWWPVHVLGTGKEWDLIDALGTAYLRHISLSEEELLAIPAVLRLRDATSLIHRIGRYLAGLETDARIQERVQHSLWREAWLSTQQETLVLHTRTWKK